MILWPEGRFPMKQSQYHKMKTKFQVLPHNCAAKLVCSSLPWQMCALCAGTASTGPARRSQCVVNVPISSSGQQEQQDPFGQQLPPHVDTCDGLLPLPQLCLAETTARALQIRVWNYLQPRTLITRGELSNCLKAAGPRSELLFTICRKSLQNHFDQNL